MSTLLERQKEFTAYLESGFPELQLKGLPLISACAITGNASQENLVKPVTTGPKDHGSDGVLQWRLDRLDGPRGLKGWAASIGWDWATLRTQAAFTLWETFNDPRYVILAKDLLAGTKTIETLTANFCWVYERPSRQYAALDTRISHAKSVYMILTKERSVSATAKAGGATVGGGLIAAGAANAANGGGDMASAASIIAGLVSVLAPWIMEQFKQGPKAPPPAPSTPAAEPATQHPDIIQPLEIIVSETAAYDAAKAHRMAIEAELAVARAAEEKERMKVAARAKALLTAIGIAQAITAPAAPDEPLPAADAPDYIEGLS